MKRIYTSLFLLLPGWAGAQLYIGPDGMTMSPGTVFSVDSLLITPSVPTTIGGLSVFRSNVPVPVGQGGSSISRVYSLSQPLTVTGTVGFYYRNDELNGHDAASLQLIHDPTTSGSMLVSQNGTVDTSLRFVEAVFNNTAVARVSATGAFSISGRVVYDLNGLNGTPANTIDGPGTNAGGLRVVLVDTQADTVVEHTTVATDGTFSFSKVWSGYYKLILTTQPVLGNTPPAASAPAGWAFTGEFMGAGSGSDGTADGVLWLGNVTADIGLARFGVQQAPVATDTVLAAQPNPGVLHSVPVPATAFLVSDDLPGGVPYIVIPSMPSNAYSITVNGVLYNYATPVPPTGITIPANPFTGQPQADISIDPIDGGVTVEIPFYAIDEAGTRGNTASIYVPFQSYTISGNVHHDANGLLGSPYNTIDGPGTTAPGLRAVLVRNSENIVVAEAPVDGAGNFSLSDMNAGDYRLMLTTASIFSNLPPLQLLPAGWVYTGEQMGAGAGNDGLADGQVDIGTVNEDKSDIHFGIQQLPEATNLPVHFHLNPGGAARVAVTNLQGYDPEDGAKGTGDNFVITSLPANGTLYYNQLPLAAGDTITQYDPALLEVDPADSQVVVNFTYSVLDNAGFADPSPAAVTMVFNSISLAGNVWNDANGLVDHTVNGTPLSLTSGQQLYAHLVEQNSNNIIATTAVQANGSYYFSTLPPASYVRVYISTLQGVTGQPANAPVLPQGWLFSGEYHGAGAGNDGSVDGQLQVFSGNSDMGLQNVNFGLNRAPAADEKYVMFNSIVLNVPLSLEVEPLSGVDPEDGAFGAGSSRFVFGTQPDCCADVYYDGQILVTGTVIPNYDPSLLQVVFNYLPYGTVAFTYAITDAAGVQSPMVNYTIQAGSVLPVQWQHFSVQAEGSQARLGWTTAQEQHNAGFVVERSSDGRQFIELGFLASKAPQGNSVEAIDYHFYDQQPQKGTNFYRLRQVDLDGKFNYSIVQQLDFGYADKPVQIYPNPVGDRLHIDAGDHGNLRSVRICDLSGKEVFRSSEAALSEIDFSRQTQGTYLLTIEFSDGSVHRSKIVKK
jgi:hypothetical protein